MSSIQVANNDFNNVFSGITSNSSSGLTAIDTKSSSNVCNEVKNNAVETEDYDVSEETDDIVSVNTADEHEKQWWEYIGDAIGGAYNYVKDNWEGGLEIIGSELGKTDFFKTMQSWGAVDATKSALEGAQNVLNEVGDVTKVALATGGNILLGVGKGIFGAVESVGDTFIIAAGGLLTPFTGLVDMIGYATGNDFGLTNSVWNKAVKPMVNYKIVDNAYNDYYATYGKVMNDNSLDLFKTNGLGYSFAEMGGTVLATLAGGEILSGTGMFGQAGTLASKAGILSSATVAGISGFGQGVEDAWTDHADILSGLTYGAFTGALDFTQYVVGGLINGITVGAGESFLSKLGSAVLRVSLDGVDNAAEVPLRALFKTVYNGKSFAQNWEESGGWTSVLIQALLGSAISAGSEGFQMFGAKVMDNFKKNNSNASNVSNPIDIEVTAGSNDKIIQTNNSKQKRVVFNPWGSKGSLGNNLDTVYEILNEYGRNNGYDNYAETALRQYAKTGSVYNVDGKPYITRTGGVRDYIESIDPRDVANYLDNLTLNSVNSVVKNNLDKTRKILNEWGKNNGYDNYAETALRQYAKTGSVYNADGKPYITRTGGVRDYIESIDPKLVDNYLNNRILSSSNVWTLNGFFKNNSSLLDYTYGVDQGGISNLCVYYLNGTEYSYHQAKAIVNDAVKNGQVKPQFKKIGNQEYADFKKKLVENGFSEDQASVILSSVDDVGACTYAAKANSIFYKFSENPSLFEEKFGFPMYKVNSYGEKVLNANELLLDLYVFANDTANGGHLFYKNLDDPNCPYIFNTGQQIDVFGRKILDTSSQQYLSTFRGTNPVLNKYLDSKGLSWDSYNLINNRPDNVLSNEQFNDALNSVINEINEGKSVQLNVFGLGGDIRLISMEDSIPDIMFTKKFQDSLHHVGGHAVFITGINNQGFLISSWGREYLVPFSDLQNGGAFNIMIDDVNLKN